MKTVYLLFIFFLIEFAGVPARAQDTSEVSEQTLGEQVGVIDQFVKVDFEPVSVVLLVAQAGSGVEQFPGVALPVEPKAESPNTTLRNYIVGTVIPLKKWGADEEVKFSFFLASKESEFAATEVKAWSINDIRRNSSSTMSLKRSISELEKELSIKKADAKDISEKLEKVRERASAMIDVGEMARLNSELSRQRLIKEKAAEAIIRIRVLIDEGRKIPEPEWIDQYRQQVYADLAEAAKVSAVADRLSQRKKDAAQQSLIKKLELVKQMDNSDPAILAKEVMVLRKQRKELESQLGLVSTDSREEDF